MLHMRIQQLAHTSCGTQADNTFEIESQAGDVLSTPHCGPALTVAAKIACAVVGDSGVVALLLLGPFRALPA
jgi:hypothetical protein